MKKMMNLLCAACLTLSGAAAAMPTEIAVYAEETAPTSGTLQGGQTWSFDADGVLTISGTGEIKERYTSELPWTDQIKTAKKAVIGEGITNISGNLFNGFSFMEEISIPETVTAIGSDAFSSCMNLAEIKIPDAVTTIGDTAFIFCYKLANVSLSKNVTSLGRGVFAYCRGIESINVDAANPNYCSVNGVLFNKDQTELLKYPAAREDTAYVIPESVKTIGYLALEGSMALADITFPAGLERIDTYALNTTKWLEDRQAESPFVVVNGTLVNAENCEGDVTVPENVRKIGNWAFYRSKVSNVVFPENVVEFEENSFYNVKTLESVTIQNPDCKFPDGYSGFPKEATIYGQSGSTAEAYAEKKKYQFAAIGTAPEKPAAVLGDFDGNGTVGAEDAQDVLNVYAEIVADNDPKLTDAQKKAADVNNDGAVDATDAQFILIYYVENSIAGNPTTWEQLLRFTT